MNAASNDEAHALAAARQAQQSGRPDLAEERYREVLHTAPENAEALCFVGTRAALRSECAVAFALLARASTLRPNDPSIQEGIGIALVRAGRADEALRALTFALSREPQRHIGRLFLGQALGALGQTRAAAVSYHRAISQAQKRGLWVSAASTAPLLLADVTHAVECTRLARRQIIDDALAPVRQRHGASALTRVERCVAMYLGELAAAAADARQKPKALFFPDLPTSPYLERNLFPWADALEQSAAEITEELRALLADRERAFAPFLGNLSEASLDGYLRNDRAERPVWDAFFFYRHGVRENDNHRRCPTTSVLLDAAPLAHIRDHAPEVCFSMLTPGTHILPHHGDTNSRVVLHLPLLVPRDCALNVGGETHVWREGEIVAFDDTFEHEAWNRGDRTRVVLIVDAWNPYLSPAECEALTAMVPVLGDFDRECSGPL